MSNDNEVAELADLADRVATVGDFAGVLDKVAELIEWCHSTWYTDSRVVAALDRVSHVIEIARANYMVVTGEIPTVVVDPQPGEQVVDPSGIVR